MNWHEDTDARWFTTYSANELILATDWDEDDPNSEPWILTARRAVELLSAHFEIKLRRLPDRVALAEGSADDDR